MKKTQKNVVYSSFSYPHQHKIAEYLKSNHNWIPSIWICSNSDESIKSVNPQALVLDTYECRRGIFSAEIESQMEYPIDMQAINALSEYELIFYDLLSRYDKDGKTIPFNVGKKLYYKLIKNFTYILKKSEIDIMVSWTVPHGVESYVLYLLCKYYKIPTLMLDPTRIFELLHPIVFSLHNRSIQFNVPQVKNQKKIDPRILDYLKRLEGDYNHVIPDYMKKPWGIGINEGWSRVKQEIREIVKLILKNPFKEAHHFMISRSGNPWDLKTDFSNFGFYLYRKTGQRKISHLKKYYQNINQEFDKSKKYIYYAAAYQPEATTSPDAGVFSNQLLCLKLLTNALPEDWVIYYKEHPSTFWSITEGFKNRSKQYYDELCSLKNVIAISNNVNTFELIDNSQCVSTPTGTVGFESVVRGKPAIIFGAVWYEGCEGVFRVDGYEKIKLALDKIQKGYKPDKRKILEYVSRIETFSYKDLVMRNFVTRMKDITDKDSELLKIAESFYKSFEMYNKLSVFQKSIY